MFPVLLKIGPVTLYSYGLMVALGFWVGLVLAGRRAQRVGLDPSKIQSLALWVLGAGLVGARAAYVILNWEQFRPDRSEIFRLDHGGLIFYGALALGLAAGIGYIRWTRLPAWRTLDLMMPPLALAHAFGRIGCFLNGCCFGKPTALPWAVAFPQEGILRHPTQLYEAAALVALFFILKAVERRGPQAGTVTLVYGFLYGTWRFFNEFLRGDSLPGLLGWTPFQWISVALVAGCGAGLLVKRGNRGKR